MWGSTQESHHLPEGVCNVGHMVQGVGEAHGVEVYGVVDTWMLCWFS